MLKINKIVKECWGILTPKQKQKTGVIFSLMLLATVMEALGIGVLLPAISIILDESIINKHPFVLSNGYLFPKYILDNISLVVICIVFIAYCLKTVTLAYVGFIQSRYIYQIKNSVSKKIFQNYLMEDYNRHIQRNLSKSLVVLTVEINDLVHKVISPLVLMFAEITVVIALACLLFAIYPAGAFTLSFSIIFSTYLFQIYTKSMLGAWGRDRQYFEHKRVEILKESQEGYKEIKIYNKESIFNNIYSENSLQVTSNESKELALSGVPRLWIEFVGLSGLLSLLLMLIVANEEKSKTFSILAAFVAVAYRILPSMNRIVSCIQSLRYSESIINSISSELKNFDNNKIIKNDDKFHKPQGLSDLTINSLSFSYVSEVPVLSNLSISFTKGRCIGIVGKSGSGKSTFLDILSGLLTPQTGEITINGNLSTFADIRNYKIGYVPQSSLILNNSIKNNIVFEIENVKIDTIRLNKCMSAVGLGVWIESLEFGADTYIGPGGLSLSGGQRKRIAIARALYHQPDLLILDEATSSLDVESEEGVLRSINELKKDLIILMISHQKSGLVICDNIYKLDFCKLIELKSSEGVSR
jgi:ABC-type multidrug transport system fused ATPase/permease subunit